MMNNITRRFNGITTMTANLLPKSYSLTFAAGFYSILILLIFSVCASWMGISKESPIDERIESCLPSLHRPQNVSIDCPIELQLIKEQFIMPESVSNGRLVKRNQDHI